MTKGYIVEKCPHCGGWLRQRSTEKNSRFHAVIAEISQQKQWAGEWLGPEQWKRLVIAAWERTQGRSSQFFPAIDGAGFDVVYRRSSRLTREEIRELILFVESWALDQGVTLKDLSQEEA